VPLTLDQQEKTVREPSLCEQLPVRDYLDNVVVRTNGPFVAGYELKGFASYFESDEGRDRGKLMLEALLRSLPEQSMRVQFRYEVVEDLGELLEQYVAGQRSERTEAIVLDDLRVDRWKKKETSGDYARHILHLYFIWDAVVHHRLAGKPLNPKREIFSLSAGKSIERSKQEHRQLLSEFESLLKGVETGLEAAELGARRMSDEELFGEAKRALNPLYPDGRPYRRGEKQLEYSSAREQIADVSIVDETDMYLNVGGILYSFVSLKELPDATFPGILRELTALDFPIIVNAQITIPDQARVLKGYKSRLRKMQAAQRDSNGGFRINVEAQVAEAYRGLGALWATQGPTDQLVDMVATICTGTMDSSAWKIKLRALPADEVLPATLDIARDIAANTAPESVSLTKQLFYQSSDIYYCQQRL